MLLNLPLNASVMPLMSSHIDELEDALADGHEFNVLPVASWFDDLSIVKVDENGKKSKPIQWLPAAIKERGVFEMTSWPVGNGLTLTRSSGRNSGTIVYIPIAAKSSWTASLPQFTVLQGLHSRKMVSAACI